MVARFVFPSNDPFLTVIDALAEYGEWLLTDQAATDAVHQADELEQVEEEAQPENEEEENE